MLIIVIALLILIACISLAIILSFKLPHKPNVQLEVSLYNDSDCTDCSLNKVILNLEIANNIEDIENAVQQNLL